MAGHLRVLSGILTKTDVDENDIEHHAFHVICGQWEVSWINPS